MAEHPEHHVYEHPEYAEEALLHGSHDAEVEELEHEAERVIAENRAREHERE